MTQIPKEIRKIMDNGRYEELIGVNRGKAVILFSGGIDSTVAMFLAKKCGLDVIALEFYYTGRSEGEMKAIDSICNISNINLYRIKYPELMRSTNNSLKKTIKISLAESNALYYTIAGGFSKSMGAEFIIGGQILSDWENTVDPRATPHHYRTLNKLLNDEYKPNPPKIIMPFIYLAKNEVVKIGHELGVPFDLTWSCSEKGKTPCRGCDQCRERENSLNTLDNQTK
ncbi:MAG: 7-cyano-7-deazaguanine synthase [Nanoarchaeota archaeon]